MEGLGSTEMSVAHILKIEGNKLAAVNAKSQQFLFDQSNMTDFPLRRMPVRTLISSFPIKGRMRLI